MKIIQMGVLIQFYPSGVFQGFTPKVKLDG